jgi:hypothetical protein
VVGVVGAAELVAGATVAVCLGAAGTFSFGMLVPGPSAVTDAGAGPPLNAGARPVGVLAGAGADVLLVAEAIAKAAANGTTTATARPSHRQRTAGELVPETTPISLPAATPIALHPPVRFVRQS